MIAKLKKEVSDLRKENIDNQDAPLVNNFLPPKLDYLQTSDLFLNKPELNPNDFLAPSRRNPLADIQIKLKDESDPQHNYQLN